MWVFLADDDDLWHSKRIQTYVNQGHAISRMICQQETERKERGQRDCGEGEKKKIPLFEHTRIDAMCIYNSVATNIVVHPQVAQIQSWTALDDYIDKSRVGFQLGTQYRVGDRFGLCHLSLHVEHLIRLPVLKEFLTTKTKALLKHTFCNYALKSFLTETQKKVAWYDYKDHKRFMEQKEKWLNLETSSTKDVTPKAPKAPKSFFHGLYFMRLWEPKKQSLPTTIVLEDNPMFTKLMGSLICKWSACDTTHQVSCFFVEHWGKRIANYAYEAMLHLFEGNERVSEENRKAIVDSLTAAAMKQLEHELQLPETKAESNKETKTESETDKIDKSDKPDKPDKPSRNVSKDTLSQEQPLEKQEPKQETKQSEEDRKLLQSRNEKHRKKKKGLKKRQTKGQVKGSDPVDEKPKTSFMLTPPIRHFIWKHYDFWFSEFQSLYHSKEK